MGAADSVLQQVLGWAVWQQPQARWLSPAGSGAIAPARLWSASPSEAVRFTKSRIMPYWGTFAEP